MCSLAHRESVGLGTAQAVYQLFKQEGLVEAKERVVWFVVTQPVVDDKPLHFRPCAKAFSRRFAALWNPV
ncbi:MAG: hypothetical protein CME05_06680 [Gemmatimonadaceae bacterium]|nr:hypothetical protein [Gemmatimonadaceae bacterium]